MRDRDRCALAWVLMAPVLIATVVEAEPIHLSQENPRYFSYHGKPTVLITSAEHYGAIVNLDFDYLKYLDALRADGLNYTRVFSGVYVEPPGAFGIRSNTLAPAQNRVVTPWKRSKEAGYAGGGSKFDLDQWNDEYFARMRDFLTRAESRNIIVELTLFCSLYTERNWRFSPLHPTSNVNGVALADWKSAHTLDNGKLLEFQEKLVRKLVQELNAHENLFFEIQNEPYADHPATALILNAYDRTSASSWYKRSDLASSASLAWQNRVASFIIDEEGKLPNRHLIAQNFATFKYPLATVPPEISILNFHHALPEAARWNLGWKRVVGFDETGSLGAEDISYRKPAWHFILAGGAIYNNLDYSFSVGHEDGLGQNEAPGGGSPALRKQLKVLKDFIESFEFARMAPDDSVVRHAPGAIARTLAEHARQYAIYLDGRGPVQLELALPAGEYQAEWVNTQNGRIIDRTSVSVQAGTLTLESPNFGQDIGLRILATRPRAGGTVPGVVPGDGS